MTVASRSAPACERDFHAEDLSGDLDVLHAQLVLSPSHPLTRAGVEFEVQLDGEQIVDLVVKIGFAHRGFEKECETCCWEEVVSHAGRLNSHSGTLASLAYCLAVEELIGCASVERSEWLRVLASEIARVGDHLSRLGAVGRGLGSPIATAHALEAREWIWDLQESLCGARVATDYVRIGGVRYGLPEGFEQHMRAAIAAVRHKVSALEEVSLRNRVFLDRLRGTGVLSRADCIRHAVTGPLLRAAGADLDCRKAEPYLVYGDVDFDVPVGEYGDNYDRYLVCLEELRQSLRIMEQCVERLLRLGPGPTVVADAEMTSGAGGDGQVVVPPGESYAAVESANGELGFYLLSDGSSRPRRIRCRPPSLLHLQALAPMLRGAELADFAPTFDLVNAASSECDR
ncbi:NADH-quinone oxidoreductase subunit D [Myxococcota bacterium]|nr:NADH-quinone oxidoreductase subunit D [Myxococcota bacterium]